MNKFFDNFYNFAEFGPAIQASQPTTEILDFFGGKLPARLIEYWQEYGFSGWGEGAFWTVNPSDYSDVLSTWLQNTPFENKDNYYVIGRSAFGRLFIWGETSGQSISISISISISVNFGMIFPTDDTVNLEKRGQERSIDLFFANNSKDGLEEQDLDENPLFERAMALLGPLDADEMYGFVPALAIGGAPKLENLQKVKVIEHLTFLADLGEKTVMADIVAMSNALHK